MPAIRLDEEGFKVCETPNLLEMYAKLKQLESKYFKKGITFKRTLSYCNYFGFADPL